MKILQVPILFCFRCETTFTPKIDPIEEKVLIPELCPKRDCRSKTWNVSNEELELIRKTQNKNLLLGPGYRKSMKKSMSVLDKYKPKKSEKVPLIVCVECEIFYHDEESLKRHQHRRHHGMCMKCHSSNVYVVKFQGQNACRNCMENA